MTTAIYACLSADTVPEILKYACTTGLPGLGIGCMASEPCLGEPYVTRFLCREAFVTGDARIPAATLRERLPEALRLAAERARAEDGGVSPEEIKEVAHNLTVFVEFCALLERVKGEPTMIAASL